MMKVWVRTDTEPEPNETILEKFGPIFEEFSKLDRQTAMTATLSLAVTLASNDRNPIPWGMEFSQRFGAALRKVNS